MVGVPGAAAFQLGPEKRVPAMPGSPVEVKIQSRSSPPTMPPLPPINPGGPRPMSFTPTALSNGTNHSPPTLNGAPSPPQRFSNGPASSTSSALTNQQLPATCGARQLSKLKRFLTTLQQFGNDISPEIGEKVRTLVLALVNSTVTIEEFHCKLQEATNFPLRPFVIPFLKANLPLLQRELLHCARAAKQTPSQYLAQHEHLLLNTSIASPADSSELLMEVHGNGKRPSPERREDNGFERDAIPPEPPAKRVCTISPAPRHSPALSVPLMNPGGQFHPTPPPLQHYTLEDIATSHLYREPNKMLEHREVRDRHHNLSLNGGYQDELVDHRLTEREWADEWKHLDHALNCIMEMVEKTRRSMAVLRRCQESDRDELNYWKRRYNENTEMRKTGNELVSRQHSPGSADPLSSDPQREFNSRPATGYVPVEFWKKTEEAVNKVKIQAMSEVQKAVAEAEQKAFEVIATERARMEQTIADVKRQAAEDAFLVINEQEESTENCWNCGRKASETCSGCNIARYCGSFCQHKDWERHHRLCGQNLHGQSPHSQSRPLLPGGRSARSADCSVPSPALDKTSATTSRSSTPASVTAIDSNGL
ncbi:protein CBFA2T2 isoform X2 [Myotis myotis]|uniref:CBFA2/RUNX1 partner transcriptional co-repressor 2 n=1 Tax=Myotis myotis TaxID=51298 RepID=A0A7J7VWY2_MYOMY|nr:protein CBFA2T2 isoform X2 [Myotis myotis]KAF6329664.1 CBFA2/RUNX1 partner transcriptional co-repressor 2 [Myotis myotis]